MDLRSTDAHTTFSQVVWKQKTEYTGIWGSKTITHVIVLVFAEEEGETKIKYHKDLWSKDDYQHTGFGHVRPFLSP